MRTPNPLTSVDPRQIGRYRLIGRLGAGGQGVVYLGEDPAGTAVAIKALHAVTADSSASPRQESPRGGLLTARAEEAQAPAPATEPASRTTGHPPSPTPTTKVSRPVRPDRTPTADPEPKADPGRDKTPEPFPREADVILSNPLGPDSRCSDPQDGPSGLQFRSCIRVTAGQVLFSAI
ncbi:hypothetical protein [Streptosporangium canum]|uniref:hypothetical protein n=1 Tax=Streptosporangium canum TaxID=324952 RepID=UPI0037B3BD2F